MLIEIKDSRGNTPVLAPYARWEPEMKKVKPANECRAYFEKQKKLKEEKELKELSESIVKFFEQANAEEKGRQM